MTFEQTRELRELQMMLTGALEASRAAQTKAEYIKAKITVLKMEMGLEPGSKEWMKA